MVKLIGEEKLWQWDLEREVMITPAEGISITDIEFYNLSTPNALVGVLREVDGIYYSKIPNILLQSSNKLTIYLVEKDKECRSTKKSVVFEVHYRAKPDDYVYTETEIKSFEALEARLEKQIDEEIKNATEEIQNNVHDGKDGQNGKDGKDGADGKNGKSAYQYAQDGGYTGTEEEFGVNLARVVTVLDGNEVAY